MNNEPKPKPVTKTLQVNIDRDVNTVSFGSTRIEIRENGKVTIYAYDPIQTQAAAAEAQPVKGTQFSMNEDRSEVALNGITVRKAQEGHLILIVPKDTDIHYMLDPARIPKQSPAPVTPSPLKAGQRTKDGIYIGRFRSKDGTEKDWFAADRDISKRRKRLFVSFNEAADFAAQKAKYFGHRDWVLPPGFDHRQEPDILNALYRNEHVIGFREMGYTPGWYWSSSNCHDRVSARAQRLSDGYQLHHFKGTKMSARLVRSVPVVS